MNVALKVALLVILFAVGGALVYYFVYVMGTSGGDDDGIPVRTDIPFFDQVATAKFVTGRGYLLAHDVNWFSDPKTGFSISLEFMITSGAANALLAITNALVDEYFAVYVWDGMAIFEYYVNGEAKVSLRQSPAASKTLADGQWHSVRAVKGSDAVWSLNVDSKHIGHQSAPGLADIPTTDLFFGNRSTTEARPGVLGLSGCMRNVRVNDSIAPPIVYAVGNAMGAKKCVKYVV